MSTPTSTLTSTLFPFPANDSYANDDDDDDDDDAKKRRASSSYASFNASYLDLNG